MRHQRTSCHSRQQYQQDSVPHLAPSAGQPHTSRLLRYVAWLQLSCCIVFIGLLLLLDPPYSTSRQQQQQQQQQHQQQQVAQQPHQQHQQHDGTAARITPCQVDTQQRELSTADTLTDPHCLPVMVCTLLSKSSHTAHLHKKHCSNPDIHYSGLLPSCTLSAAKVSLLLLDICGLLLAVALLHLTSPRDVHTVVPGWAWVPNGSLPVCQQQLGCGRKCSRGCWSSSMHTSGPDAGTPLLIEGGSPVASTVEEGWPAVASGGHWFAVTVAAETWVSRRSRWVDAVSMLYLLLVVVLTWILLSQ